MALVDESDAQIPKLGAELRNATLKGRAKVVAKVRADIRFYCLNTTYLKGLLAAHKKRGTGTVAKTKASKKSTK